MDPPVWGGSRGEEARRWGRGGKRAEGAGVAAGEDASGSGRWSLKEIEWRRKGEGGRIRV
jgi:hypothetical protein